LRDAIAAEQQLPPPWPRHAAAFQRWLDAHGAPLTEELHKLVQTEAELERRARESSAGLDPADRHLQTALARLRQDLEQLVHDPSGARAWTIERLRFLRETVEPSLREHAEAWRGAAAAIKASDDIAACRAYRGLRLPDLPGLVPLGADPASKLWEFLDCASHEPGYPLPARDANGRLVAEAGTGIVFVLLPAGRFDVGARRGEPGMDRNDDHAADDELQGGQATLDAFLIARCELTAMQWARLSRRALEARDPMLPATSVSWHEVVLVLRRYGMRLPSEAQWEYAARANGTEPWCSGSDPVAAATVGSFARLQRIGLLAPNEFGLFDLHGNVAEWCADEWLPYADFPARQRDGLRLRESTASEAMRAVRGGAFHQGALGCRTTARDSRLPVTRDAAIGVRPVRALDAP
jgi:formylglycine-generating enzyme required for sulfatase activity